MCMRWLKNRFIVIFLVISFTYFSVGCGIDTNEKSMQHNNIEQSNDVTTLSGDPFADLEKYLNDSLPAMLINGSFKSFNPKEVYEKVVLQGDLNYFVVDIRSSQSFAEAHIESAVNIPYSFTANPSSLANIPRDKTIIVACYSGHTAGQTALFWQLLGYKAYPLLNGMGGWNKALYTTGGGSALKQYDFPVVTENEKPTTHSLPRLYTENASDIQALLIKQAQAYLLSGKSPVVNGQTLKEQVLDRADNLYFLVDIRSPVDYSNGHILDAINIPARNIAEMENLKKLPADKKIIVVGYDGTDASEITRLLNILGYDAFALFQGMRIWTTDEAINGVAPASTEVIENYPLEKLNYDLQDDGGGTATCG